MEAKEEAILAPQVMKGKRTKRPRLLPKPPAPAADTSESSVSSDEIPLSTPEEAEMANCLILLARGPQPDANKEEQEPIDAAAVMLGVPVKLTGKRCAEAATANCFVYECKTCSKCFPSFQALGGHRASHKKLPKPAATPEPPANEAKMAEAIDEDTIQLCMNSFSGSVVIGSGKTRKVRIHECSICGSEFASGQALGGHMRRHRPASVPEAVEAKKDKSVLSLDLNLPATADDCSHRSNQFPSSPTAAAATDFSFARKPQPLLLSTALVDCHY